MKAHVHLRSSRNVPGFSLVELLVAMAVLALLVLLLGSMAGSISSAWVRSREKIDNSSKGRALLEAMERDLKTAIFRQDLPAFPGTPSQFAFYARQFSQTTASATARGLTYVSYSLPATRILTYTTQSYDFSTAPPAWSTTASAEFGSATPVDPGITGTATSLCSGVYAFVYDFIQADGTISATFVDPATNPISATGNPPTTTVPTQAVRVSLVVVGAQADHLLLTLGSQGALQTDLATVVTNAGLGSPKAAWDTALATSNGLAHTYPPQVLSGIGTYECIIQLNPSSPYVGPSTYP